MSAPTAAHIRSLQAGANGVVAVLLRSISFSTSVYAHGGGLMPMGATRIERRVTTIVTAGVEARIWSRSYASHATIPSDECLGGASHDGVQANVLHGASWGTYTITASGRKTMVATSHTAVLTKP